MFEYGKMAEKLAAFTDSDWAGRKETRKSSSAGVLMLGRHTLKAHTRKQNAIEKCSAEAEIKHDARLGLCSETSVEH